MCSSDLVSEGKNVMHETAKHATVHSRFVMENVSLGLVNLQYVPTADQRADILTKAVAQPAFLHHRRHLMSGVEHFAALAVVSSKVLKLQTKLQCVRSEVLALQWYYLLCCLSPDLLHWKSTCLDRIRRAKIGRAHV